MIILRNKFIIIIILFLSACKHKYHCKQIENEIPIQLKNKISICFIDSISKINITNYSLRIGYGLKELPIMYLLDSTLKIASKNNSYDIVLDYPSFFTKNKLNQNDSLDLVFVKKDYPLKFFKLKTAAINQIYYISPLYDIVIICDEQDKFFMRDSIRLIVQFDKEKSSQNNFSIFVEQQNIKNGDAFFKFQLAYNEECEIVVLSYFGKKCVRSLLHIIPQKSLQLYI